ncbi:MAG: chemotaxis protein CheW [Thermodesulfobacteriaceae bacterium]|nr:chemotaxis protein CheW [Thermodesulfobacteriaceae bacterium]
MEEDILQDFLVEAKEGISKLEEEFVELEKDRENLEIIKSLFRTMHSLKGAAGFFGFKTLEAIAHFSEDILSKLRDRLIEPEPEIVDLLLKAVDNIKYVVNYLEKNKTEPLEDRLLDFVVELSNFNERLKKRLEKKEPSIKEEISEVFEEAPKKEVSKEEVSKEEVSKEEVPKEDLTKEVLEPKRVEPESFKEEVLEPKKEKPVKEASLTPQVILTETHIKVDVKLLDTLMNLAGELVLARNRVVQLASRIADPELVRSVQNLSLVTTELQETIMKTRMQPIGVVFNKFPRIVRDLSRALNKKVNLHLEGTDTELDRSLIEAIKDPLTHLIRNAIDHGIETSDERVFLGKSPEGNLVLRAFHEGGQVIIEVEDDGKGIDIEKIRKKAVEKGFMSFEEAQMASEKELLSLIFKPGFSTAENVTQVSGRGVGMDVVKTNIEKLGGSIDINTILGKGTTIRIKIPLTLAIIPALIVTSGEGRYAIPQVSLRELVRIDPERDILKLGDTEFYRLRGEIIPVLRLSRILQGNGKLEEKNLVILTTGEKFIGLLVDQIFASEEIVVKPLGKWFKNIPSYSGATIMGDGKLALILDVVGLSTYTGFRLEEFEKTYETTVTKKTSSEETQFIILFKIGEEILSLPLALVSRLDKIKASDLSIVGGKEVIIYQNKVIPIVRLENYLPIQGNPPLEEYHALFFAERGKTCAFLCTQIVDTLETTLDVEEGLYNVPGILGHRIINDRTVLFVDIYKIIEMYDPEWFIVKRKLEEEKRVYKLLLAEDSPFFRNLVSNYLRSAGYEVETAENGKVALEKLNSDLEIDLLITDIEMPEMDGIELVKVLRENPKFIELPIIVLTSLTGEDIRRKVMEAGANAYEVKLSRERVLAIIENLLSSRGKYKKAV